MKKTGFLSFGHRTSQSATRSARDVLLQSIELAEALGADLACNAHLIEAVLTHIAPALGWRGAGVERGLARV